MKAFKVAEYQCAECGEALPYGRSEPTEVLASGTAWLHHGSGRWYSSAVGGFVSCSNAGKFFAVPVEILDLESSGGA